MKSTDLQTGTTYYGFNDITQRIVACKVIAIDHDDFPGVIISIGKQAYATTPESLYASKADCQAAIKLCQQGKGRFEVLTFSI